MNIIINLSLIIIIFICIFICFLVYFNRTEYIDIRFRNKKVILSPAYGKIINIEETENNYIIFIQLNIFDIHTQYSPVDGKIEKIIHKPYKISDTKYTKNVIINRENILNKKTYDNECVFYVIKTKNTRFQIENISVKNKTIGLVQIAGKFANRIQSYVSLGDDIKQQDPIGRILLGSQVNLILPKSRDIQLLNLRKNMKVYGGQTPLAIWK